MNTSKAGSILLISGLLILLSFGAREAYADTMTLKLESVGGQSSGPDYVYPYNFSINGSASIIQLMCISFANEITLGESWTATTAQIAGNSKFEEAAYLFSMASAPGATANTIAEAQWANWELFDPNDPNLLNDMPYGYQQKVDSLLNQAWTYVQENPDAALYSEYTVYIPVAGSQSTGGLPQDLIGARPALAPEPSGLVLLGSGLLGMAALLYRKRRYAEKPVCIGKK